MVELGLYIKTPVYALPNGVFHVDCRFVFQVEIFDRTAVRNDIAAKAEFASEPVDQPVSAADYRNAVVIVVRRHHAKQLCPP
jgi:hypothetical protein